MLVWGDGKLSNYLQVGDIIKLENGHEIYAQLKEKFAYINTPYSNKIIQKKIKIGEILRNNKANDKENRKDAGIMLIEKYIDDEIPLDILDTSIFAGEYVVTSTYLTGKEDGNGWGVNCKKLNNKKWDENGAEIYFYQNGFFDAINKYLNPIGKMKMMFI